MERPKLFDLFDWCARAEALGFRIQWAGTTRYWLRRESDGEIMLESPEWGRIAEMVEALESAARRTRGES